MVIVNYVNNIEAAERVVASILEKGGQAVAIQADVRNQDQMDSLVKKTTSHFGKVDILVNNAAINFSMKSFSEMQWDEFKTKFEDELKAAFVSTKLDLVEKFLLSIAKFNRRNMLKKRGDSKLTVQTH